MSKLSDTILEKSDTGCCVIRMGSCQCHHHIDETARHIAKRLKAILNDPDVNASKLIGYIHELEQTR